MPTSETMDKPQSSQSYAQAPKKTPRPFGSTLRRYKWDDLHAAEKEAVKDAFGLAATRSAVGLGVVVTIAALLSNGKLRTHERTNAHPCSLARTHVMHEYR